jgi:hypothetical protein
MDVNIVQLIMQDINLTVPQTHKYCTKLLQFWIQVSIGLCGLILDEICCICVSSLHYSGTGEK